MGLLQNDFQIQPLDSMAVWVRRLNFLFTIQLSLTVIYVNRVF